MDIINNVLQINFQGILTFVLIYLGVLWVLICLWVYSDAKKRFKNMKLSIVFFLLVLLLNFPALIFYLIIRPETEDEHVFYVHGNDETELGGVNVPIVNFMGEDGFKISLQLKVANPKSDKESNLDINMDWKSEDKNMVVSERKPVEVPTEITVETKAEEPKEKGPGLHTKAKNKIKNMRTKIKFSVPKLSRKKQNVTAEVVEEKKEISESKAEEPTVVETKESDTSTEVKVMDEKKEDMVKEKDSEEKDMSENKDKSKEENKEA